MAPESGRPHPGVEPAAGRGSGTPPRQELDLRPEIFDFFQAVRLLQWQARVEAAEADGGEPPTVGAESAPGDEPVRFRTAAGLNFPAAAVTAMGSGAAATADGTRSAPPEMTVAFMGLTGPSGVLPLHYTDRVMRESRAKSPALRDFLDIFNHRLISLFYRAWAKYRLPVSFEGGARGGDPVTGIIAALVGLGSDGLRHRLAVDDLTVFHYGATFARRAPSAASLQALIAAHFGLPAEIRSFQPRWVPLAPGERSAMPAPGFEADCYARLGIDTVAGERVFDVSGSFRIRIGPMPYAMFVRFIPGAPALRQIIDLVRLSVGPELAFDVQCVLRRDEVPLCRLGGDDTYEPRLGWTSWLASDDREDDADDPVFPGESA